MRLTNLLAALLLLAACEPNQLYLAAHTVVGINAAVNPEQTNGSLVLGYDRSFATIIPRSVETTADGVQKSDAMAALVCSNLSVEGITIRRYTESIATGEAAATFARNLRSDPSKQPAAAAASVRDFFDCFRDSQPPPGQQGRTP